MNIRKLLGGKIRNELVFGLVVVILLSSIATYVIVRLSLRRDFDTLVQTNDIETAKTYADALAVFYQEEGSWSEISDKIEELRSNPAPVDSAGDAEAGHKKHTRDSGLPIVITDQNGEIIYSGIRFKEEDPRTKLPERFKTDQGEKVVVNDAAVAYVFFKSMISRNYNPQEEEFIVSITESIGISVLIGILMALLIGTALAYRFAKPVSELEDAVTKIAGGDMAVRVKTTRADEIGSLGDSFNLMADRLQETEKARQSLLADIAHELRTPVSIIQANLEMIIDGVYTADEERMRSLHEETQILTGLISDLRTLSDLESGTSDYYTKAVNLPAVLYETCSKLYPLFVEKGIDLEYPSYEPGVYVKAENEKLRQVVRNILGNSCKYAPAESIVAVSLEITSGTSGRDETVRVTIEDEGEGVPDGDTEKIFERFYRVDFSRNRESGGRGLGLAISKRIINAFNGKIGAYNRKPYGLAVWFELPVKM